MLAYLCSRDERVTRLDWDGGSWAAHTVLDGVSASCVATDGRRVLDGTQGEGARASSDGALYAGTEPSRLFVSRDGGAWTELEALDEPACAFAIVGPAPPALPLEPGAGSSSRKTSVNFLPGRPPSALSKV